MTTEKRTKKDLKEILADMSDPEKVLASPDIISADDLLEVSYELGEYPYPEKIGNKVYEHEKQLLQAELLKVQVWVKEEQKRIAGFFEGRDAAGPHAAEAAVAHVDRVEHAHAGLDRRGSVGRPCP